MKIPFTNRQIGDDTIEAIMPEQTLSSVNQLLSMFALTYSNVFFYNFIVEDKQIPISKPTSKNKAALVCSYLQNDTKKMVGYLNI